MVRLEVVTVGTVCGLSMSVYDRTAVPEASAETRGQRTRGKCKEDKATVKRRRGQYKKQLLKEKDNTRSNC